MFWFYFQSCDAIVYRPVWAVVGLSSNSDRPAFSVAQTLIHHGRTVVPINPRKEAALGQTAYASLLDIPKSQRVDVVDLFVSSANAGAVVDDAIKIGAKAVWFQLGVSDPQVWVEMSLFFSDMFNVCRRFVTHSRVAGSASLQSCRAPRR